MGNQNPGGTGSDGYKSMIRGIEGEFSTAVQGAAVPGRAGTSNASAKPGCVIIATVTNDETEWNPPGSLPGIGGWATVTEVKGKGTKYEYTADGMNWSVFEFTDDGTVKTSGGLVDSLLMGAGSNQQDTRHGAAGNLVDGMQLLDANQQIVTIGQPNTPIGSVGGNSQIGNIKTGLSRALYGGANKNASTDNGDEVTGYWRGMRSSITGSEVEYGMEIRGINAAGLSGPRPNRGDGGGGAGSASGTATTGVVIIRVPRSSDNSGLPAGPFDEPVTLAPGLEGAGPEVPEAPEPEEGGALFSRTYTLNSDPSTEPGLLYPSTNYIKLNREDALVWQENVEDGVDILCELLPDGVPGYRRRYFNLYYYVPQTGSSKLKFYDGYDGSMPAYVDKAYKLTAYPAGQIPDDETLDAASAQAAAVEARESVKTKRKKKK
jgi:hypothetical protein